jgi:hypothetical protein
MPTPPPPWSVPSTLHRLPKVLLRWGRGACSFVAGVPVAGLWSHGDGCCCDSGSSTKVLVSVYGSPVTSSSCGLLS